MIKIGYHIKAPSMIQKIWKLQTLHHELLLYELEDVSIDKIKNLKIDLLIFEFDEDEIKQLENFESIKEKLKIRGICILKTYTDDIIQQILKHHIQYTCDLEISVMSLYVMLLQMINDHQYMEVSVYDRIEEICLGKHLLPHLKGYDYVKSAILYYIENERDSFRMKDVYDTIAKRHHTTSSRVEKNMRMAIHASHSPLSNAKFVYECFKECQNE